MKPHRTAQRPATPAQDPGPGVLGPAWSCSRSSLPADFPQALDPQKNYMANVSTVGQDKTPSPWGTYDQGGNAVEILDTLAPQPPGYDFLRDWHYYHGGVANAPAYQLEISAFGYFPGDTAFLRAYPWLGSGRLGRMWGNAAAALPLILRWGEDRMVNPPGVQARGTARPPGCVRRRPASGRSSTPGT